MKTGSMILAFDYLRLSNEEARGGESSSITNQRMIIENYCRQNGIILVREFVDDGYSGGNFERPGFQEMLRQLQSGKANCVITKDLSRLGRDMRESSYYAEQFFPENGIRYIAISDNFDTEQESVNVMAPFQFAMNEVYLRDGSRKVRDVLKSKRESGQYCACPPYGYRKDQRSKRLIPDEITAPIVARIFERAALGDSSRKIALDLTADGVIPPLKYRVLYRDDFSDEGAARASDVWNYTTVKRILKNRVYLGHTALGRSKKVSVKSKKKLPVPKEKWAVTTDTHQPLVSEQVFELAQQNLGRGSSDYRAYDHVRKSIFSGVARCARCGHALCSAGTVYKGEREKYWFLSCTNKRTDIANPCEGVRIRYADLLEVVRRDLNELISLTDDEMKELARKAAEQADSPDERRLRQTQLEKAQARILSIDRIVGKLYGDNAEGKIDDARLDRMVSELEQESFGLRHKIAELQSKEGSVGGVEQNYALFFERVKRYSHIEQLDRDTLLTFVERIEIGPKELPEGVRKATRRSIPYRQKIRIFYKFVGELSGEPTRDLPLEAAEAVTVAKQRETA